MRFFVLDAKTSTLVNFKYKGDYDKRHLIVDPYVVLLIDSDGRHRFLSKEDNYIGFSSLNEAHQALENYLKKKHVYLVYNMNHNDSGLEPELVKIFESIEKAEGYIQEHEDKFRRNPWVGLNIRNELYGGVEFNDYSLVEKELN